MRGARPRGLSNALHGIRIDVVDVRGTDELRLRLAVRNAMGTGSCGSWGRQKAFLATLRHYYPQARSVCLVIEGDPLETALFHDVELCPFYDDNRDGQTD
jgi:hypothetical protein